MRSPKFALGIGVLIAAAHGSIDAVGEADRRIDALDGRDTRLMPRIDDCPDVRADRERRPKERRRIQKLWGKRP